MTIQDQVWTLLYERHLCTTPIDIFLEMSGNLAGSPHGRFSIAYDVPHGLIILKDLDRSVAPEIRRKAKSRRVPADIDSCLFSRGELSQEDDRAFDQPYIRKLFLRCRELRSSLLSVLRYWAPQQRSRGFAEE